MDADGREMDRLGARIVVLRRDEYVIREKNFLHMAKFFKKTCCITSANLYNYQQVKPAMLQTGS
jgi:hypothetical protein